MGSADSPPHIFLDRDDRTGLSDEGETLHVLRPLEIGRLLVHVHHYEGRGSLSNIDALVKIASGDGAQTLLKFEAAPPGAALCAGEALPRGFQGIYKGGSASS